MFLVSYDKSFKAMSNSHTLVLHLTGRQQKQDNFTFRWCDRSSWVCFSWAGARRSQPRRQTRRGCRWWSRLRIKSVVTHLLSNFSNLTWDGSQALHVRRVRGDIVENINQHKKYRHKKCHAARNNLRGNQEPSLKVFWSKYYHFHRGKYPISLSTHPWDYDEQSWRQVIVDKILERVPPQRHLEPGEGIVPDRLPHKQGIRRLEWVQIHVVIQDCVPQRVVVGKQRGIENHFSLVICVASNLNLIWV